MYEILVVDDDTVFLDTTSLVLERHGYTVRTARGPEEGLAEIERDCPDLVILDVMMPRGYEGFEVARQVRERLGLHELPLLILTSLHEAREVLYRFAPDATYLPVDRFLDKPVSPEQLVRTLAEMLGEPHEEPGSPL